MGRLAWIACAVACGLTGCAAVPPVDNPVLIRPNFNAENPILVAPGLPTPEGYMCVYDRVLDAVDDYFDVIPGSRYSGEIKTLPRIARGFEQPWKPGTPDPHETLLATFQTIRHYAIVRIVAGDRGGYRVSVEVYKELEDLASPAFNGSGASAFREAPTVDRRVEVVSAVAPADRTWIPRGRDPAFEQDILRKIQVAMCK